MRQTIRVILSTILLFTAAALCSADDSSAVARYSQGINLFFGGQYAEAMEYFNAAAQLSPENPAYRYFIGLCWARLGNPDEARKAYIAGAAAELTPAGAGIDVPSHLMRIQGYERVELERVRQAVRAEWNARVAERRAILYGKKVDQGREDLTTPARQQSESDASGTVDASLPMVPPISPTAGPELPADESEDLAAARVFGGYIYLSDELGKPMLSTITKQRIARKQARIQAEENAKLDAHGNKFVDIYADDQVKDDGKEFKDPDEKGAGLGERLGSWLKGSDDSTDDKTDDETEGDQTGDDGWDLDDDTDAAPEK
ncbi:MAG: tetratricopeptide repeat protein [Thermoguttaceae bacterium]|nr:tetratricopeptide repeat protein [Thermoguttaceae bacterium]